MGWFLVERGEIVRGGEWNADGTKCWEMVPLDEGPALGKRITRWHKGGRVAMVMVVKKDSCFCERWYANGNRKSEKDIRQGRAHGIWKTWNEDGMLTSSEEYRDGVLIRSSDADN